MKTERKKKSISKNIRKFQWNWSFPSKSHRERKRKKWILSTTQLCTFQFNTYYEIPYTLYPKHTSRTPSSQLKRKKEKKNKNKNKNWEKNVAKTYTHKQINKHRTRSFDLASYVTYVYKQSVTRNAKVKEKYRKTTKKQFYSILWESVFRTKQ